MDHTFSFNVIIDSAVADHIAGVRLQDRDLHGLCRTAFVGQLIVIRVF